MNFLQKANTIFQVTDLKKCPISILCISIDQLSGLSERYGNRVVKSVMKEFAGTLVSTTRDEDLVGYYNKNDEDNLFIAMLLDAGESYIDKIIVRLNSVVQSDLLLAGSLELPYSISVGHTSTNSVHNNTETNLEQLIDQARAALLATKELEDISVLGWQSKSDAA